MLGVYKEICGCSQKFMCHILSCSGNYLIYFLFYLSGGNWLEECYASAGVLH